MLFHQPSNFVKVSFLTAFFLFFTMLVNIVASYFPAAGWSIFSFGVFGLYILGLAKVSPVSFLLLLPYVFFRATTLVSGIAIEHGGFMEDISLMGEPTGAYTRLVGVYIFFVGVSSLVIEAIYPKVHKRIQNIDAVRCRTQNHAWVLIFFGIFIVLTLYMIKIGITLGFPLLTNMDRLVFREEYGGRFYIFYMSNRIMAALILGIIIYLCTGLRRNMALVLFILMIGISVLFGEKFTSLMLIAIYGLTPAYILSGHLRQNILKHLLPAIAAISVMTLPIILAVYGWGDRPQDAIEKMTTRMVGQGELWFAADQATDYAFRADSDVVNLNLASLITSDTEGVVLQSPYLGVNYFMYNYMDLESLSLFLARPSLTLTFGLEAYFLISFGWIGMLFPFALCAIFYVVPLLYLAWGIENARPTSIFLAGKLLIWMVVGLAQGFIYLIFGYKIIIFFGFAIFYELVSNYLSKRQKVDVVA